MVQFKQYRSLQIMNFMIISILVIFVDILHVALRPIENCLRRTVSNS